SVLVHQTNAAHVTSSDTSLSFLLDTQAPVVTETLNKDTGSSSTDHITNASTLTGSGDPHAVVHFTVDGVTNEALIEIIRRRLEGLGPVTTTTLGSPLSLKPGEIAVPLASLEAEGFAMRGRFTARATEDEWCERRLLSRIHHYTIRRLRAEIEPVAARDF